MKPQIFTIIPASNGPIWFLVGIVVFLVLLVSLFAWFAYASRNVRFELSDEGLRIAGDMYGRTIPYSSLVVDRVEVLDLSRDRQYQPKWRTNGAGLPGYAAGWFKLRNGEKSLCFLTSRRSVVYVPTREGYSVMMSVERAADFTAALASAGR
jgi:hypothetical protein